MSLKETKKIDTNRHQLEITVDGEKFREAIAEAYKRNGKKINVPGFRKGKAPLHLIEKYYGAEIFFEDALNLLYNDLVEDAIKDSGLKVINDKMDFEMVSISKEDGADFKVSVTTYPEIEIGEYKGLKAEKVAVKVTPEEVEAEVNSMAERNARMVSVEDRAAQNGDTVIIDFEGFKDGVAFDGGKAEGHSLTLGSGQFIPGFEDQIVGKNIGDEFDVNVTFPDGYGNDMDGKAAVFKTTLNYIKIPVEAEYNDALVAANTSYKTTAEYEESIRSELKASNEATALTSAQNVVMTNVINKATIENIPAEEVSSLADEIITQLKSQASNYGIDYATFIQYYYGYEDEDSFKEYVNQICQESVKEKKVVCAVAKAENITIDSDDETAYIKKLAEENDATEDSVKEQYSSQDLMYYTLADKVMTFLLDNGKKTETTTEAATEATSSEEETTTEAITEAN
mgnify:CR=1 FL=1